MFSLDLSVPVLTVFAQGLLSFFSPCVLPLIPLYIGYFAGGASTMDADGNPQYPRKKVFANTLFFVLGISATFFILGFGFTALGQFFNNNRLWFVRISGIVMILFGLYQFGLFHSKNSEREWRLPFKLDQLAMGPLGAFILGFAFSFAWTPCVGPILGSVLLMAGSAGTMADGFLLIGVYTLGFVLPFLAVGLFTAQVLAFFKKHKNIVRYTVKAGAILLILMGLMTLTGFMNGLTGYLSNVGTTNSTTQEQGATTPSPQTTPAPSPSTKALTPAPDFTLTDQNGVSHRLSDYKGKTVFLNFWATWCPPCRGEMPDIQKLYEAHGKNQGDLIVLGVASPNVGQEGSAEDIKSFLSDNGYTFPVVMDEGGTAAAIPYGISAYPTTYMIDTQGNIYGYVSSALTMDMMKSIVEQTQNRGAQE